VRGFRTRLSRLVLAGTLVVGLGTFASTPTAGLADENSHVCTGTAQQPGTLTGSFTDVTVKGICFVSAGAAIVHDRLTVSHGGALVAAFGTGNSHLTLYGDLRVEAGATLILGCDPRSFACFDDPNQSSPTLSSHAYVHGDLTGDEPLGVLVHNTTVGGDVRQTGGGGGVNCTPQGVFALPPPSPVYSTYEDSQIAGDLTITGLRSCWLGVIRDKVGESVRIANNKFADPDAIEIETNHIGDDLSCSGNSMTWDGADEPPLFNLYPRLNSPNTVRGDRSGQCSRSTPTTLGGPFGPPGSF
jgi:hypothetical protein